MKTSKIIKLLAALCLCMGIAQATEFVTCQLYYKDSTKPSNIGEDATMVGWFYTIGDSLKSAPSFTTKSIEPLKNIFIEVNPNSETTRITSIDLQSKTINKALEVSIVLTNPNNPYPYPYQVAGTYNGRILAGVATCKYQDFDDPISTTKFDALAKQIDILKASYK